MLYSKFAFNSLRWRTTAELSRFHWTWKIREKRSTPRGRWKK